jgi:putative addiction module component (TIGR02574 family)
MPRLSDLSVEERLRLVQDLWDSIVADTDGPPIDPDQLAEIRSRLARYRSDGVRGELARDAVEDIRRTL